MIRTQGDKSLLVDLHSHLSKIEDLLGRLQYQLHEIELESAEKIAARKQKELAIKSASQTHSVTALNHH